MVFLAGAMTPLALGIKCGARGNSAVPASPLRAAACAPADLVANASVSSDARATAVTRTETAGLKCMKILGSGA